MFGFVYIWYDRKHKRFYVGSHKGKFDDGYICSSSWMLSSYKRRPLDFKRKILSVVYSNRKDLLNEEQRYLDMIKDNELGKRYYNLKKSANGGFSASAKEASRKLRVGIPLSEEHRRKQSEALTNKPWSEKRKKSHTGKYTKRLCIFVDEINIGSREDAAKLYNVNKKTIDRWCDHNSKHGKFNWRKEYEC